MSARDAAIPSTTAPEEVREGPASRKVVWWTLHEIRPATFQAVITASGLSDSATAIALSDLVEEGIVQKQPSDDGRVPIYDLPETA